MVLCDMCGKETDLVVALIEGTELNVCRGCAKHGSILRKLRSEKTFEKSRKIENQSIEPEEGFIEKIVEDYGNIIKKAREKLNIKQEDFARKINEKVSLIHNLESGHHEPSIKVAQKIERFLRIKLVENNKIEKAEFNKSKSEALTIGDLIKLKK